jgi:hypothetical protein
MKLCAVEKHYLKDPMNNFSKYAFSELVAVQDAEE